MQEASAHGTHSPAAASKPVTVPLTRPHCGAKRGRQLFDNLAAI